MKMICYFLNKILLNQYLNVVTENPIQQNKNKKIL